jgi:hypothetical protein
MIFDLPRRTLVLDRRGIAFRCGRPGSWLKQTTCSPIKGGSASVSPNRLSYCCPATIFRDVLAALFGRLRAVKEQSSHDGCGWLLRRSGISGANLLRLGRIDASLPRLAAGHRTFSASSFLKTDKIQKFVLRQRENRVERLEKKRAAKAAPKRLPPDYGVAQILKIVPVPGN